MLNRFLKAIKSFQLPINTRVIIAVSGGIDSVALAHLFAITNDQLQLQLGLAHITHNMRDEQAGKQDLQIVQSIAKRYCLPLHLHNVQQLDLYTEGKEQVARTLRRQWLKSLCTQEEDRIALAHHAGDQVETVLMRLQKRYPLRGLAGIPPVNEPFIRPLLHFKKRELQQFLQKNRFDWHEDSTNEDLAIERNYTRRQITHLKKNWIELEHDLLNLSQQASHHNSLMNYLLAQELGYSYFKENAFSYPYTRFLLLHYTVRNELIFYWFNQLMQGVVRPDFRLPARFVQAINLKPNGSILLEGHGISILRKKDLLIIVRSKEK